MMKLEQYKIILISTGLIVALLIASPSISGFISRPLGEQFSEFYLLGPERMAEEYPHNIMPNQDYTVYFDVGNHIGSAAYYLVYIKFLNASDILPDVSKGIASTLQPLQEYRFLVQDERVFEKAFTFSFSNAVVSNNQLVVGNLILNGWDSNVNKESVWNSTKSEYQYKLLFELWFFNSQTNMFEFNNRFVYLQLNCTSKI